MTILTNGSDQGKLTADYCDTARAVQVGEVDTGELKADCYEESGGW